MSKRMKEMARRKELLLARSALQRLEVQGSFHALAESLPWLHRDADGRISSSLGSWLLGLALRRLASGAIGRGLAFTSGALVLIKLVRFALGLFSKGEAPAAPEDTPTPSTGEG